VKHRSSMEVAQTKSSEVGVLIMEEFLVKCKRWGPEAQAVTISGLIFRRGDTSPSSPRTFSGIHLSLLPRRTARKPS
jgi:hypothetical protein